MPRSLLAILGAFVVIAGIVLVVVLGRDKAKAAGELPSPPPQVGDPTPPAHVTRERDNPSLPKVTDSTGPAAPSDLGSGMRDYAVGDIRVRDHRAGDQKPLDIPPNVHPAEGILIPSTLTHEISQKVKAVVLDCAKSLPAEARGDKPRLEGQISISIKGAVVTVTKSTMVTRNVTEGPANDAMKACAEQKVIGLTNPAPDQPDIPDYTINLSYAIP